MIQFFAKKSLDFDAENKRQKWPIDNPKYMQSQNRDLTQNTEMSLRVERVSTALYMVTNHLSDREPLKSKIRTLAYESIEMSYSGTQYDPSGLMKNLSVTISLLQVAAKSKMISAQNTEIIIREISAIKDFLYMSDTKGLVELSLSNLFADLPKIQIPETVEQNLDYDANSSTAPHSTLGAGIHNSVRGISTSNSISTGITSPTHQVSQQTVQTNKPHSNELNAKTEITKPIRPSYFMSGTSQSASAKIAKKESGAHKQEGVSGALSDRQLVIIKEIRLKGQLTIRDLVDKITGCSEKTIQRDLLALVENGVLKKEGERRWSKYSIGVNSSGN